MEATEDVEDLDMEAVEGMEDLVTTDDQDTITTEDMVTKMKFAPVEIPKEGSTWELLTKQKLP